MKIKQAQSRDLEKLSQLRFKFALFEQKYIPGSLVKESDPRIKNEIYQETKEALNKKKPIFFIVEDKEELAGYMNIFLYPDFKDKVFIGELYINEVIRNKGVANKLLKFLTDWIRKEDKNIIHVSVSKANKLALKFFQKEGFKKVTTNYINLELSTKINQ